MSKDDEILDSNQPSRNYRPIIRKLIFGITFLCLVTGIFFRIMHFPYSWLMSLAGGGMLSGFFIKRFFYAKEAYNKKIHYVIIPVLFTIYFVTLYSFMPMSLVYFYLTPAIILFIIYPIGQKYEGE